MILPVPFQERLDIYIAMFRPTRLLIHPDDVGYAAKLDYSYKGLPFYVLGMEGALAPDNNPAYNKTMARVKAKIKSLEKVA